MGYKPLVNVLFVEGEDEYYFGNMFDFDPATGKASIQTWWRDDTGVEPITGEFETNVDPVRIAAFPCCLPNVGVENENVFHMPSADPRTWQIGNLISKNQDGTVTYSVVDKVNPGQLVTQSSIPTLQPLNSQGSNFYYPIDYYKISNEVCDWFAANWGPI